MATTIIKRELPGGKPLEISIEAIYGQPCCIIALDGAIVAETVQKAPSPAYLAPFGIELSADEYSLIGNSLKAIPEAAALKLRGERNRLISAREGILDEIESARERAFNGDGPIPSYDSPEFRAAAAAIAAFDAEHPEVLASLKVERKARADAHMWD
jgi:hypothetical protein